MDTAATTARTTITDATDVDRVAEPPAGGVVVLDARIGPSSPTSDSTYRWLGASLTRPEVRITL